MVDVAQLVRASDCGSEGRRFESGRPPYPYPYLPIYFIFIPLFYIYII